MKINTISSCFVVTMLLSIPTAARAGWISQEVLADNHRAYCSDIVAGDIQRDTVALRQRDSGSNSLHRHNTLHKETKRSGKKSGGGGLNFMKIGISGKGGKEWKNSDSFNTSSLFKNENKWDIGSEYEHDRSTTIHRVAGKNCDAFVESAAKVEMVEIKSRVERERIQQETKRSVFETIMGGEW